MSVSSHASGISIERVDSKEEIVGVSFSVFPSVKLTEASFVLSKEYSASGGAGFVPLLLFPLFPVSLFIGK